MTKSIFPIILLSIVFCSCSLKKDISIKQDSKSNINKTIISGENSSSTVNINNNTENGVSTFSGENIEINFEIDANSVDFSSGGWEKVSEEEINEGLIIENDEKGSNSDIENK